MKRYNLAADIYIAESRVAKRVQAIESETGEWVRFKDAEAALAEFEKTNAELRQRLDFRNSVPGTFCDACPLWEQMAWERGREVEKLKGQLRAVMIAAQQLNEYILNNPTSDFDIPDEIYQAFTLALGEAE